MENFRLLLNVDPKGAEWVLERDGVLLWLTAPGGEVVFAAQPAHRVADLWHLCGKREIRLLPKGECLIFCKHRGAQAAVQAAAVAGLATDAEARGEFGLRAQRAVRDGLIMFVVAGTLFGVCCSSAFAFGEPPTDSWLAWVLKWFGILIGWVMLVLLALTLAGLEVARVGYMQTKWVRRATLAAEPNKIEPEHPSTASKNTTDFGDV